MAPAYLLVGLTGSGKTTYARSVLEPAGTVRLSVGERVFARHGRYGVDYPENTYFARQAPVVTEVRAEMVELLTAGRDVLEGRRITGWTGVEQALFDQGPRWADPSVPCLQLNTVVATVGDGRFLLVAGELMENWSGTLDWRRFDCAILAFTDPATADDLPWSPPR